jgi:hypothetical protein
MQFGDFSVAGLAFLNSISFFRHHTTSVSSETSLARIFDDHDVGRGLLTRKLAKRDEATKEEKGLLEYEVGSTTQRPR